MKRIKQYIWRGTQWQFAEGEQPADAIEVKAAPKADTPEKRAARTRKRQPKAQG